MSAQEWIDLVKVWAFRMCVVRRKRCTSCQRRICSKPLHGPSKPASANEPLCRQRISTQGGALTRGFQTEGGALTRRFQTEDQAFTCTHTYQNVSTHTHCSPSNPEGNCNKLVWHIFPASDTGRAMAWTYQISPHKTELVKESNSHSINHARCSGPSTLCSSRRQTSKRRRRLSFSISK